MKPSGSLKQMASFLVAFCLFKVVHETSTDVEKLAEEFKGKSNQLETQVSSLRAKAISNYTLQFDLGETIHDLNRLNPVVKVTFSSEFVFWIKVNFQVKDLSTKKIVTETKLVEGGFIFDLKRLRPVSGGKYRFTLIDVVNPSCHLSVEGPTVSILVDNTVVVEFKDPTSLRIQSRLSKLKVVNPHSEFIPGFYTSPFKLHLEDRYAYEVRVKVFTDSPHIEAVP